MVLQYGSETNKSKLMTILKDPYAGSSQSWYDYVVSMFRQNGDCNSMQKIAAVQSDLQSNFQKGLLTVA